MGHRYGADRYQKAVPVLHLDSKHGIVEVEAGIEWPELIDAYLALQNSDQQSWGIAQKQRPDRTDHAGTIAANAHGRGLRMRPLAAVKPMDSVGCTWTARTHRWRIY